METLETTRVFSESMCVTPSLSTRDNLMRQRVIRLYRKQVLVTESPFHHYNSGAPTLLHLYYHLKKNGVSTCPAITKRF